MKYFVLNEDKTACRTVFLSYNSVLYNKVRYFTLLTIQALLQYFRLLWLCHVIGGNTVFLSNLQFSAYHHSSGIDTISGYCASEFCSFKYVCAISSMYFQMLLPQLRYQLCNSNAPHLPHTYSTFSQLLQSQSKVLNNTSCVIMLYILYLDL